MQSDILNKLHVGHQGIRKCRERAKQAVWCPGISKQLEKLVSECPNCIKFRVQRVEPLIPSPLPNLPWQKLGTDLFEWDKTIYLLIIDYYSCWIEIAKLTGLSANSVINRQSQFLPDMAYLRPLFLIMGHNSPQKPMHSLHGNMALNMPLVALTIPRGMGRLRGVFKLLRIC